MHTYIVIERFWICKEKLFAEEGGHPILAQNGENICFNVLYGGAYIII